MKRIQNVCTIKTDRAVDYFCQCTVELITEVGTYTLYVRECNSHRRNHHTDQVQTRLSVELRCGSQLL